MREATFGIVFLPLITNTSDLRYQCYLFMVEMSNLCARRYKALGKNGIFLAAERD
jgi:hypothetical protein